MDLKSQGMTLAEGDTIVWIKRGGMDEAENSSVS